MNRYLMFFVLAVIAVHDTPRAVAQGNTRGVDLPLYYDVRTGNLTVDTTNVTGGVLTAYAFGIPFDGFIVDNFTPFMDTFFFTATERVVGESHFSGIPPGVYSLGDVIPAGLLEEELGEYFGPTLPFGRTAFGYFAVGELGSGTFHLFSPQYIPSPFPPLNDPAIGPPHVDRWATEMALTYDPGTGELALDASGENGGHFMLYSVSLSNDGFDTDAFTPITDFAVNPQPNELVEVSFESIPGDYYSLGNVLPSGLNEEQLFSLIETAMFLGEPARGSSPLDINTHGIDMLLTIVPDFPDPDSDFNADGDLDVDDVDALVAEIVAGTDNSAFDISADGEVNNVDLTQWLSDAATTNGFAAPYLRGDANLDGSVNASDVNALGQNWLGPPNTWQLGDFNADGIVSAGDLNKIGMNWLSAIPSAASPESVPEPAALTMLLLVIMATPQLRRRRGNKVYHRFPANRHAVSLVNWDVARPPTRFV